MCPDSMAMTIATQAKLIKIKAHEVLTMPGVDTIPSPCHTSCGPRQYPLP